ncbi:type I restriction enzyme HsdR N-terminal domain-containing protein [Pseudofulvibacter geojedonensis]|uniref:Type I restriction enzyme HsdR N-terminal domain-containing protein n=1 Tax=Pseudofulvibacter geojedonensis TaxID=1123758 RepID=A0ABW3I2P9_9FLAO
MQELNFPTYQFRFKNSENKLKIFDEIRKKFVVLTPEEWVRQHCVQYLIQEKEIPKSLINIEKELTINSLKKRYDIVVFHPNGNIYILIECKAPKINITQSTFDQIAQYNLLLKADFLMVTNGLNHYYCIMDFKKEKYHFLNKLPNYSIQP